MACEHTNLLVNLCMNIFSPTNHDSPKPSTYSTFTKKIGTSSYTCKSTNGLINVFKCYVSSYHDNNNILYLILINWTVGLIYETNV